MTIMGLTAKCILSAILLTAGGAKAADASGFAATVRSFVENAPQRCVSAIATAIVVVELLFGLSSLIFPAQLWLGAGVLATTCCFLIASLYGYARYPGQSCRCFGQLSSKKFDAPGILRSAVLVGLGLTRLLLLELWGESCSSIRRGSCRG